MSHIANIINDVILPNLGLINSRVHISGNDVTIESSQMIIDSPMIILSNLTNGYVQADSNGLLFTGPPPPPPPPTPPEFFVPTIGIRVTEIPASDNIVYTDNITNSILTVTDTELITFNQDGYYTISLCARPRYTGPVDFVFNPDNSRSFSSYSGPNQYNCSNTIVAPVQIVQGDTLLITCAGADGGFFQGIVIVQYFGLI